MAGSYVRAGRVVRNYGSQGKIVVEAALRSFSLMRDDLDVWIVPPLLREDRHRRVVSVSHDSAGDLVALSGIDTPSVARQLVGRWLLVRKSDVAGHVAVDFSAHIGAMVRDARRGSLGKLVAIQYGPANDVWTVQTGQDTMLLPVRVEWVVNTPRSYDGEIVIDMPEGALGVRDDVS